MCRRSRSQDSEISIRPPSLQSTHPIIPSIIHKAKQILWYHRLRSTKNASQEPASHMPQSSRKIPSYSRFLPFARAPAFVPSKKKEERKANKKDTKLQPLAMQGCCCVTDAWFQQKPSLPLRSLPFGKKKNQKTPNGDKTREKKAVPSKPHLFLSEHAPELGGVSRSRLILAIRKPARVCADVSTNSSR